MDTFICASCGKVCEKTRSDEEAWAEDKETFGDELTPENAVMVCGDCYDKIMNPPEPNILHWSP